MILADSPDYQDGPPSRSHPRSLLPRKATLSQVPRIRARASLGFCLVPATGIAQTAGGHGDLQQILDLVVAHLQNGGTSGPAQRVHSRPLTWLSVCSA